MHCKMCSKQLIDEETHQGLAGKRPHRPFPMKQAMNEDETTVNLTGITLAQADQWHLF